MAEPIVHRDQTEPRSPADYLRAQLSQIELKARRVRGAEVLPAAEVRQAIGQAAGALEGLEDRALEAAELRERVEELEQELAEVEGASDPEALALWRGRYMAEAQEAAEAVYADSVRRGRLVLDDARRRADARLAEAERRAQRTMAASPGGLPVPPDVPLDRIEAVLVRAQYLDGIRSWLAEQDAQLDEQLDESDRALAEARQLRARSAEGRPSKVTK